MTPEPIPIHQGQDFYVPTFEVRLDGERAGRDVVRDVLQVTYKDSIEELDSFEISINNWDAEDRTFKYTGGGESLFDPGKVLELSLGYFGQSDLRKVITGEVTSLRPTFPAAGRPTLSVSGLNRLHRLRIEQVSEAYLGKTDSQIARRIADRINQRSRGAGGNLRVVMNTDAEAESEETAHDYLLQDNEYDIVFLMTRARRIGYDLFVEESDGGETTVYFGPSENVRRLTYRLAYGSPDRGGENRSATPPSLIQFQPNLTTANQVGEVTVVGWDRARKEVIRETATRSDLQLKGVGAAGGQAAIDQSFNHRREVITSPPVYSRQEAQALARRTLANIAKDLITASGSTVGLPDLRAGTVVEILGLGNRFSGRYFVTSTTHTLGDSGYTTSFECRREET